MQSHAREVVDKFCEAIREDYLRPDLVPEIVDGVRRATSGLVGDVPSSELAERLTLAAQEASKDLHLAVRLFPLARDAPDARPGSDEFSAERRRRARREHFGVRKVEHLDEQVGLLELTTFGPAHLAGGPLAAAMSLLAGTEALLVDLRENQGGAVETVALLVSYFVDEDERPVLVNRIHWTSRGTVQQLWTASHVAGARYGRRKPVYVLIGPRTFSAAEELAYDLQAMGRAVVVGARSRGGANPGDRTRLDPHLAAFIPTGLVVNPVTGTNWEGTGVRPDIEATDALDAAWTAARAALHAPGTPPPAGR